MVCALNMYSRPFKGAGWSEGSQAAPRPNLLPSGHFVPSIGEGMEPCYYGY